MKKLFCFLAVAATAAFTSCSSDDDSGNNGENPGTGNEVTAITLNASATSVELGTAVTFNVVDQDGGAVANATLTANGNAITSPWTAETAGEYTVVATLGELTDTVTVTVTATEEDTQNKILFNDNEYDVAQTALVLWGGANLEDPEATEATHAVWSLITYTGGDFVEAITDPTTVNAYMEIGFYTALDTEGNLVFPGLGNTIESDIYTLLLNGEEVVFDATSDVNFVLNETLNGDSTATSFTLAAMLDGNAISLNYEGSFDSIYQPSGRPAGTAARIAGTSLVKANNNQPLKVIMLN